MGHRWVNGPKGSAAEVTAAAGPPTPQETVDSVCREWKGLWEGYSHPLRLFPPPTEPGPLMTAQDIWEAAGTFPSCTGLGLDWLRPRALLMCGERVATLFGQLLRQMEREGGRLSGSNTS